MNLSDFSFWLNAFYFLVAIFFAFYIPGDFFVKKINLKKFQEVILSFGIGIVLWGWQGFIFGYLGFRWFTYIYLVISAIYWFKKSFLLNVRINKLDTFKYLKTMDLLILLFIIAGSLLQLTSVWFTGILTGKGLHFCCGNIADNILMISYTNEIVKNFPPLEPGMFATPIQNYHYWGSLVVGELVRVFHLPLIATNYQYMTVFVSLFLGLSALVFAGILNVGKV